MLATNKMEANKTLLTKEQFVKDDLTGLIDYVKREIRFVGNECQYNIDTFKHIASLIIVDTQHRKNANVVSVTEQDVAKAICRNGELTYALNCHKEETSSRSAIIDISTINFFNRNADMDHVDDICMNTDVFKQQAFMFCLKHNTYVKSTYFTGMFQLCRVIISKLTDIEVTPDYKVLHSKTKKPVCVQIFF